MTRLDDLDEAFHAIILAAVNSPRTQRLLDTCRALMDRPRFRTLPEDDRPYQTLSEHRRVVDAIRTGDVDFASAALRVHLKMVAEAVNADLKNIESPATEGGK